MGRWIGSAALVADGLHARTDGFTSLAVVAGALGVMAGFPLADPIVGSVRTVAILIVLKSVALDIYRRSWTPSIPTWSTPSEAALRSVQGVIDIDDLRLRWIGHPLHAETALVVDPALTVVDAQAISTAAQHHLLHQVPKLATATMHVSPAGPAGPAGDAHHAELQHHR
ncbi:cation diffusion facilitator family transporter [Pseudonocardia charpentierae]|uniref:cation diffusion facilitator family transporter n=1 Tax=Pseudonocardia charpentierae TaxID=3075545 RepID=UPI0037C98346